MIGNSIPCRRDLLRNPRFNRGTAFTAQQRAAWGLTGLLPAGVLTLEEQMKRSYQQCQAQPDDLVRNGIGDWAALALGVPAADLTASSIRRPWWGTRTVTSDCQEAPMTAQPGDEIMIITPDLHQPVREGEIREIRHDLDGVVYLVQWSDTGSESLLPHGPNVVIKHRRTGGRDAVAIGDAPLLSRLRHLGEWRHNRDLERRQQAAYERLASRVEEILAGIGLVHDDWSIGGSRTFDIPEVVSVTPGPPVGLDIRMLPGQTPDDFSPHAPAIAYDLGMAEVRVVPLGPSYIRLELVPHDRTGGSNDPPRTSP